MIGNAAAALQGAPITTLDFDFCYRDTPANVRKLKAVADRLNATLSRPFAPVSKMVRIEREDLSLQADFLSDSAIGIRFAALRSRAAIVELAGVRLYVASLPDIANMKRRANRPKDRAALYAIEETIREIERRAKKESADRQARRDQRRS